MGRPFRAVRAPNKRPSEGGLVQIQWSESARPLFSVGRGPHPFFGFAALCTGSGAIGARLASATAFFAISLHCSTIVSHTLANRFLRKAGYRTSGQKNKDG